MFKKIALGILVVVVLFFGFVALKPGSFHYEKVSVIHAPPDQVYQKISQIRKGADWTPWEKQDPEMKKAFSGADAQPGALLEFIGDKQADKGRVEIMKVVPNELVELKFTMIEPNPLESKIEYKLKPVEGGTEFTWTMSGEMGFKTKLFTIFVNGEKKMDEQFTIGTNNLKNLLEVKAADNSDPKK